MATEKGKQEGKEEAQETEGTTKADPGALHDKPFGDAPPPINENLSNEPAPTFNVSLLKFLLLLVLMSRPTSDV